MTKRETWIKPRVEMSTESSGCLRLENPTPLADYRPNLGIWLQDGAEKSPGKPFLLQRDKGGEWKGLTYSQARLQVNRLSNGLVERGLGADSPIAVLSENCIDMAILQLAAMQVGIPVAPISYAYSVRSSTGTHIQHILDVTRAGMLVVSNADVHISKVSNLELGNLPVFAFSNSDSHDRIQGLSELFSTDETLSASSRARFDAVTPDTLAKIQFTSGSTDMPKGVEVTHGMQISNQIGIMQSWPFLTRDEVVADWLPWNHTFGGNFVFNMILMNGGTFYIDHGNPTPAGLAATIANIKDVSPTLYFGVPRSLSALYAQMKIDDDLRAAFFKKLRFVFSAAAALDQATFAGLRAMSADVLGAPLPVLSGWGSTETAPGATLVHWEIDDARVIGLPFPGVSVKLVPHQDGKYELRVKGPNVTKGYYRDDQATRAAFDDEGYFLTRDAGKFLDPENPCAGLIFDGRFAENFKLSSGVWVHCERLRGSINQLGQPFLLDLVVAAPDRDFLTALVFPNVSALRRHLGEVSERLADDKAFLDAPAVRTLFVRIFKEHNSSHPGSSTRFERIVLLSEMPRIEDNETTDKGYINQAAVLRRRAVLVDGLYAETPGAEVVVINDL